MRTQRYYIAPVLPPDMTTGPDGQPKKPYHRLALDDCVPGISFAAIIPHLPNGKPAFGFGIGYAKAEDWSGVDADTRCVRIFQGADDQADLAATLDVLSLTHWADMPQLRKNAIRNALNNLGVSTADIGPTTALREILQKVGRFLQPGFDETALHVDAAVKP